MSIPPPFVDIHCHLLPGIDDDAKNWDDALAMARMAVADGIATIVATPHQLGSHADNAGDDVRRLAVEMQDQLDKEQIPLRVLPGADVRIEPNMVALVRCGQVLSLADKRRHVLLELPHDIYVPLDKLLDDLAAAGMTGILSHPERNRGILRDRSVVRPLVDQGCLMQITAGSLLGDFGSAVRDLADWLIVHQLVHFVSTDAHGVGARKPELRPAFERVAVLASHQTAVRLFATNPRRVAAGLDIINPRPLSPRRGLASWLGWK